MAKTSSGGDELHWRCWNAHSLPDQADEVSDYVWLLFQKGSGPVWVFSFLKLLRMLNARKLKKKLGKSQEERKQRDKKQLLKSVGYFHMEPSVFTASSAALDVPTCPRDTRWIKSSARWLHHQLWHWISIEVWVSKTLCAQNWSTSCPCANNGPCHVGGQWQITSFQATEIVSVTSFYFSSSRIILISSWESLTRGLICDRCNYFIQYCPLQPINVQKSWI